MSVNIIGDKSVFLSKNAITRLKKDVKENSNVEFTKYLKEGYMFEIENMEGNFNVKISAQVITLDADAPVQPNVNIQTNELDKEQKRNETRKQLKNFLSESRKNRTGEARKKLMSLRRSIPTKIFDTYTNLITKYKLDNIPAPDEVINNVDKYRFQISAVLSKVSKVSDDVRVSNDIHKYFTALGDFLGIEPINIKQVAEDMNQNSNQTPTQKISLPKDKDDSDTEDEDD